MHQRQEHTKSTRKVNIKRQSERGDRGKGKSKAQLTRKLRSESRAKHGSTRTHSIMS